MLFSRPGSIWIINFGDPCQHRSSIVQGDTTGNLAEWTFNFGLTLSFLHSESGLTFLAHLKNALHRGWTDVIQSKLNQPTLIPHTNLRQILFYYVLPPFSIKVYSEPRNGSEEVLWLLPRSGSKLGVSGTGEVGREPPVTPHGTQNGSGEKMVRWRQNWWCL